MSNIVKKNNDLIPLSMQEVEDRIAVIRNQEVIVKYDIDEESRKLLEEGHKEILQSECYEDYGYPSYIRV